MEICRSRSSKITAGWTPPVTRSRRVRVNFGTQTTNVSKALTFTNNSTQSLYVWQTVANPGTHGWFNVPSGTCKSAVAPGATCTLTLEFLAATAISFNFTGGVHDKIIAYWAHSGTATVTTTTTGVGGTVG